MLEFRTSFAAIGALVLLGACSLRGTNNPGSEEPASNAAPSFDDSLARGIEGESTVNVGPFHDFESRRKLAYTIRQTAGAPERELAFVSEDSSGNRIHLSIVNADQPTGTWKVGASGLSLSVHSGSTTGNANEGQVTITTLTPGRVRIAFTNVLLTQRDGEGRELGTSKLDDGWIEANVEHKCFVLAEAAGGIMAEGKPLLQPTLDETSSSAFCKAR